MLHVRGLRHCMKECEKDAQREGHATQWFGRAGRSWRKVSFPPSEGGVLLFLSSPPSQRPWLPIVLCSRAPTVMPPVTLGPFLCVLLLLLLSPGPVLSGAPPIPSEIWPLPSVQSTGGTTLYMCTGFTLTCAPGSLCPAPLPVGLQRYAGLIFFAGNPVQPPGLQQASLLCGLSVSVASDAQLSPTVDESYNLTVPGVGGSSASLTAATQWGALRGLESFLQLIVWQGPDAAPGLYAITNAPVQVMDAPRFTHRGVLIDTSFNFLTTGRIQEVLDSMAVMKCNILHWHALDDPAFSLVSTTHPQFTAPGRNGTYAQAATYTPAQQSHLAAYAWERGVMILLEFDVPGHSASWGAGGSNLVVSCPGGHQTLINPVGEPGQAGTIYGVLGDLMAEFTGRLGSPGLPWVHLGGDEVTDYSCWDTSPAVQAWAASLGIGGDPQSVRSAFTARVQEVALRAGLRPLFWEETFTGGFGVNTSSIVTPWVSAGVAGEATALGHDVLNYRGGYLDQWVSPARTDVDWSPQNVSYGFIDSWKLLYAYDPLQGVNMGAAAAAAAAGRVLGGVASAWGDNVDSSLGAAAMLYPRGLAVGEKLWSPAHATAVSSAWAPQDQARLNAVTARLEHARCRLVQRGVGASPVGIAGTYGFCWRPEWGSGSSLSPSPSPSPTPSAGGGAGGGDLVSLSSGALAAAIVGAVVVGALGAVLALHVRSSGSSGSGKDGSGDSGAMPSSKSKSSASASASATDSTRMVALDQLRGITMFSMLFVNLYYGRSGLPPFFSHGITYCSGPDLVEPAFHFAVGAALRLVVLKRLAGAAGAGAGGGSSASPTTPFSLPWWQQRWAVFKPLLQNRVAGLIILSMFFTEGWGSFDSWGDIGGFGDWITRLVQNRAPYHTLLHIALVTVYTFLPMTMGWRVRVAQFLFTAALHMTLHATFYFRWIALYTLDEGGYFGFLGWALEALAGSLAFDAVMHYRAVAAGGGGSFRGGGEQQGDEAEKPLLQGTERVEEGEGGGGGGGVPLPPSTLSSLNAGSSSGGGGIGGGITTPSQEERGRGELAAAKVIGLGALALCSSAYLLSCLGTVASANPVCYDGTRIFFWGGFGPEVPCTHIPTLGGSAWAVLPPFLLPNPATNVVTMWSMTQRAGSATYHLFTAGTSAALFAALLVLCESGVGVPGGGWWPEGVGSRVAGLHTHQGRIRLHWHVAGVLGENALAVYLLSDPVGDHVGDMLPQDCPAWYFLLWGEGLYLSVVFLAATYLRTHKLFLRL